MTNQSLNIATALLEGMNPQPDWQNNICLAFALVDELRAEWPQVVGKPAYYWHFTSDRSGGWTAMIRMEFAGMKIPGYAHIAPLICRAVKSSLSQAIATCYIDYRNLQAENALKLV